MTKLLWDHAGQRFYETGVDHGVLYLQDGTAIPWNGLISVEEDFSGDTTTPYYIDGVKYMDDQATGDFSATLKAFTYPDEFLEYEGIVEVGNGLYADGQEVKPFGLAYRTLIGNDTTGTAYGYKIHVLYNLIAVQDVPSFESRTDKPVAVQFSWKITAIPEILDEFKSTAHFVIDTRYINPYLLRDLEGMLFGNDVTDALLPSLQELVSYVQAWDLIEIHDNGDGTWTATGPPELVVMLDETTFQLNGITATWLDTDTYQIKTTDIVEE